MRVWRICRQPYARTTLDGVGGLYASGRWHLQGHPILYTASSAALAALEALVHVDSGNAPSDLRLLTIHVPDELPREELTIATLPRGWNAVPGPPSLQAIGTQWLRSLRGPVLVVPSAIIPEERNLLLNPKHPALRGVRVTKTAPFSFDPRLV